MSTPQDPRGQGQPAYNPYGQQGGYRAGQQPGQYASSPLPGQGYQQQPYPAPGPPPPGGYDPYGGSARSEWGKPEPGPVKRPGLMVLALVLMVLAALPFLFGGVAGLMGLDQQAISDELIKNPQFAAAGATPELVASLIQVTSVVLLVGSLVYLLLAVLAFRGRNWARVTVTVLSVAFALLLAVGLVGAAGAGGVLGFVVFLLVATVGGVVLLFLPDSNRFFAGPR